MPLLLWRDEFSVGVPAMDQEHEEIIQLVNKAHDSQFRKGSFEVSAIELLSEIHDIVSVHFAGEEKLMRGRHYDQYVDHKADHERLLNELLDISENIENQNYYDQQVFLQHLNAWFGIHFKTKDRRLHQYLNTTTTPHSGNAQDTPRRL